MLNKNVLTFPRAITAAFIFFAAGAGAFADDSPLTLKIAVMGSGNELYFWFGHIGLIIEDSFSGESDFYDYGLFSFGNDNFFRNFAFGRLLYSCGVSRAESNYNTYRRNNRSITIYTLDVPLETIVKVMEFADNNVLPENRDYYYHLLKDNCSTRIRDIIDIATNGQFSARYKNEAGRYTLREHVHRYTWFSPAADWFLSFLMGQVIDAPITVWEEMFLPAEVGKRIEDFYYNDINGIRRKLVTSRETVFASRDRPAILEAPRTQWPRLLILSILLSLVIYLFFFLESKKIRAGRIMAGISAAFCGLIFGFSGSLLYFMAIFTNHDYTYQNLNMIYCTPLLLAVIPLGVSYITAKKQFNYLKYNLLIRIIWLLCLSGIIISMLIKLLPPFYQDNLPDQVLMLPVALAFVVQPAGLKEVLDKFFPKKAGQKQRNG